MTDPRSSLSAHMRPLLTAAYGAPTDPATQGLHEAAVTNVLDWLRAWLGREEVLRRIEDAIDDNLCEESTALAVAAAILESTP